MVYVSYERALVGLPYMYTELKEGVYESAKRSQEFWTGTFTRIVTLETPKKVPAL